MSSKQFITALCISTLSAVAGDASSIQVENLLYKEWDEPGTAAVCLGDPMDTRKAQTWLPRGQIARKGICSQVGGLLFIYAQTYHATFLMVLVPEQVRYCRLDVGQSGIGFAIVAFHDGGQLFELSVMGDIQNLQSVFLPPADHVNIVSTLDPSVARHEHSVVRIGKCPENILQYVIPSTTKSSSEFYFGSTWGCSFWRLGVEVRIDVCVIDPLSAVDFQIQMIRRDALTLDSRSSVYTLNDGGCLARINTNPPAGDERTADDERRVIDKMTLSNEGCSLKFPGSNECFYFRQVRSSPVLYGFGSNCDCRVLQVGSSRNLVSTSPWAGYFSALVGMRIEYVFLRNSVDSIPDMAFLLADTQRVIFETDSRIRRIGFKAFGFSTLREITIPRSVEHIDMMAFWMCKSLMRVDFEKGERTGLELCADAFAGTGLKIIYLPVARITLTPSAIPSVQTLAFENGANLSIYGIKMLPPIPFPNVTKIIASRDILNMMRPLLPSDVTVEPLGE
jgi:hypothetical protein